MLLWFIMAIFLVNLLVYHDHNHIGTRPEPPTKPPTCRPVPAPPNRLDGE